MAEHSQTVVESQPHAAPPPPDENLTGVDYARDRQHLRWDRPIVDIHAHVHLAGPESGTATIEPVAAMFRQARSFGVVCTLAMSPVDQFKQLREALGDQIQFNIMVSKKPDEPDLAPIARLEKAAELGACCAKLWAAPSGHERSLRLLESYRREALTRMSALGIRLLMVHVADPDAWFSRPDKYADTARFGHKMEHYLPLVELLENWPELHVIAAHMGGWPERPDLLAALLERYPQLHLDTSATKWIVRAAAAAPQGFADLIRSYPDRILFGTDLVVRHALSDEHYASRYWVLRTLFESSLQTTSPIRDPDFAPAPSPPLTGLGLTDAVLAQIYWSNARRLLGPG